MELLGPNIKYQISKNVQVIKVRFENLRNPSSWACTLVGVIVRDADVVVSTPAFNRLFVYISRLQIQNRNFATFDGRSQRITNYPIPIDPSDIYSAILECVASSHFRKWT